MGVMVQRDCLLKVGQRKFRMLAILIHEVDDVRTPVIQVQDVANGQIFFFDLREDLLLDFGEDYSLEVG